MVIFRQGMISGPRVVPSSLAGFFSLVMSPYALLSRVLGWHTIHIFSPILSTNLRDKIKLRGGVWPRHTQ